MVFFNYSTMQVSAKIVYYGPGLCGKTTNLQHLYDHTTSDSRGEMVSLQTETDRTLFFDLLPIDLGSLGGFKTRLQLYTVPGQVFYNTTRKLVLKGVDGVVFVADSQRLMLEANVDSLRNLKENLAEMGIDIADVPMVLQYNKRDLPDISTVEDLQAALNGHGWPSYEASALLGQGVFDTLVGIAKLTMASLKDRLGAREQRPAVEPSALKEPPAAAETVPAAPSSEPKPAAPVPGTPPPSIHAPAMEGLDVEAEAPRHSATPIPETAPPSPATLSPESFEAEEEFEIPVPGLSGVDDVLAADAEPAGSVSTVAVLQEPETLGDQLELDRELELRLPRAALRRARGVFLDLRFEDAERNVVGDLASRFDIGGSQDLAELLMTLRVLVTPQDDEEVH